jgi:alkanesulfonate monooxygenase SsuD/methylene tetrahydromethanopterin reductase-like flavin-dependent oxidoreductase (luciferase family)
MMTYLGMHFDWRAPDWGAPPEALYAAALEQCAWADKLGFAAVAISTHHGSPDNYCPSPFVAATAIAARTQHLRIAPVLALPLFHPLRVAEDAAVLDLISNGRLDLTIGAGYRQEEFAMFGVDKSKRGGLMEEGLSALHQAWTGEPFEFRGETVRVTPRPLQRPGPRITMGGWSNAAARRAARYADAYMPVTGDSWDTYLQECAKLGKPVPPGPAPVAEYLFLYVTDDPDKAWSKIGPHALHVSNAYAAWLSDAGGPPMYRQADTVDELKKDPTFRVLTPEQCIELARQHGALAFDPLFGGLPPELAWESLELFESRVLPALRAG